MIRFGNLARADVEHGADGELGFALAGYPEVVAMNFHPAPAAIAVTNANFQGIAVATVSGFILGLTTLRLKGHYLAMITISFQQIFDLILNNWIDFTKGPDGIAGITRPTLFGYTLNDDRAYLLMCAVVLYAVI